MTRRDLEAGFIFLLLAPAGILVLLVLVCQLIYDLVSMVS